MEQLKLNLFALLSSFALCIIFGEIFLPILRKLRAGQPILKYVEEHKTKSGTSTMGGLFFILSSSIIFFVFDKGKSQIAFYSAVLGLAFMIVGFLDDLIKIKRANNEGLKAYQKIIFQTAIAITAGFFALRKGITVVYIPFTQKTVDIGWFVLPLTAFVFIAITNGVNLTDGLDGLACSTSIVYLLFFVFLLSCEKNSVGYFSSFEEYNGIILLSFCLIGGLFGFLLFNVNPARIFMGDTGSLSLGGFIGAISIFTSNVLVIPILGLMFVISVLSVIVQVLHFKRTGKRVFLMAPFHHHLQHKGLSEVRISFIYSLITGISGIILLIFYL